MFKFILFSILFSFILNAGVASGCRGKPNTNSQSQKASPFPVETQTPITSDLKVLGQGFHSSINEPFIAVIRDAETYAALTKLEGNLPKLDPGFFDSHAVVAAFLGQRNTGGYAVEIARETNGQIRVTEKKPDKGMMVPQMITSPFKMVGLEAGQSSAIAVTLDDAWKARVHVYQINSGTFNSGGGFAGRTEQFALEGQVGVIRAGKLVTLAFDIRSPNSSKKRSLIEFATGFESDRGIELPRLGAGALVDSPNPGLQASGTLTENKLSLQIGSLPTNVADGYGGSGSLEAGWRQD